MVKKPIEIGKMVAAKFRVEEIVEIKGQVFVFTTHLNPEVHFTISGLTYLGAVAINQWIDSPRKVDSQGHLKRDYYAFSLRDNDDKERLNLGDTLILHFGFVTVVDSFKLSNQKIVVFLKSDRGKLDKNTVLLDDLGCRWLILQYLTICGSIDTYEMVKREEAEGIYQYLLEGLDVVEKPSKGITLAIISKQ